MHRFNALKNRVINDYFMKSRLHEYERILDTAIEAGFEHLTIIDWYKLIKSGEVPEKAIIHRHDIDTDLRTATKMFQLEQKYGIKSTYYFRLSTLDKGFMKALEEAGFEVGYHFEELAQYCKDNRIKTLAKAKECLPEIKAVFLENSQFIQEEYSASLDSVAAHGDFVNRKLGITNTALLDKDLRSKRFVSCEAYDDILMDAADIYISDKQYPEFYFPENIFDAMDKYGVIYFTTHPRQWETNVLVNTLDNIKRIYEGVKWSL